MKPFHYVRPSSIDEAVEALAEARDGDARVIAGGQSLLLAMKDRLRAPATLVSVAGIRDLKDVAYTADGMLRVGAATTYAAIQRAPLRGAHRLLTSACADIADTPVRQMGTLVGAICEADPRFDMPVLASVLGAGVELASTAGTRTVPADQFVVGANATVCRPDEIVTALTFPAADATGSGFEKLRLRRFDAAIASVGCAVDRGNGSVESVRIFCGAVRTSPTRASAAEAVVAGRPWSDEVARAAGDAAAHEVEPEPVGGLFGPEYKRQVLPALVRRSLAHAIGQEG